MADEPLLKRPSPSLPDDDAPRFRLDFSIQSQPNDTSCGPTCLQAIYEYHGLSVDIHELIRTIPELATGGTLAVQLGSDALQRGFEATIYTYNLRIFDPTWFNADGRSTGTFRKKLEAQSNPEIRPDEKTRLAADAYLRFHDLGGKIRLRDLNGALIRGMLSKGHPILTGLSSTYLYRDAREIPETNDDDDVRGQPTGHFVVLAGYDRETRRVLVADPYEENPLSDDRLYPVQMDRLVNAILLGVLTFDANLVVIQPKRQRKDHVQSSRRR